MDITTIGLDLAKTVFQVHGVDASGAVAVRKTLRRSQVPGFFAKLPPCLVGMEACGTSHYWARELSKLGHQVRLMPPAYVKPYVKRGKTDANDAEAICEAVTRPTMRFVAMKSREQQASLALHRTRELLVKERTQLVNMIRGLLAEFGIVIPRGLERAMAMARQILDGEILDVPDDTATCVLALCEQALAAHERLRVIDRAMLASHRSSDVAMRLGRSRASGRSERRRLLLPSPIRTSSGPAASSPHGWDSHRCRSRAAARSGRGASARWATSICASC